MRNHRTSNRDQSSNNNLNHHCLSFTPFSLKDLNMLNVLSETSPSGITLRKLDNPPLWVVANQIVMSHDWRDFKSWFTAAQTFFQPVLSNKIECE